MVIINLLIWTYGAVSFRDPAHGCVHGIFNALELTFSFELNI